MERECSPATQGCLLEVGSVEDDSFEQSWWRSGAVLGAKIDDEVFEEIVELDFGAFVGGGS
jgi:hypothetical protein